MKCLRCGRELPDDESERTTHGGLCGRCTTRAEWGADEAEGTRPLNERERAEFLLPERFTADLLLGEGAFGVVYRCWDQKLRRHVAIKQPRHKAVDQEIFLREARAASQLQHPGIVQIFDVGEQNGQAYIVSEFIDGCTLRQWLRNNRPTAEEACQICEQIAGAVAVAHQRGIIHRDIKPGNILMGLDGRPRVADFGLSHSRNSGLDTLMVEGKPIGTPAFMSPEQVEGRVAAISAASDVYAIGTTLYQLLTGQLPFEGRPARIMQEILHHKPPAPRSIRASIPAALEAICLKAMAKDPDRRYRTAGEMSADLQAWREGRPLMARPGMYRRRFVRLAARTVPFGLAAAGMAGAGIGGWLWRQKSNVRTLPVLIESSPPEADLAWYPFNFETAEFAPRPWARSVAGRPVELPSGFYRVAATSGTGYFEVFRTIPAAPDKAIAFQMQFRGVTVLWPHRSSASEQGQVELTPVRIQPVSEVGRNMAWHAGGPVRFPDGPLTLSKFRDRSVRVPPFLLASKETTWGDLQAVWPDLSIPEGESSADPAHSLMLDVAIAWCEAAGLNLPDLPELYWAATNGGATVYPWGDTPPEEMSLESGIRDKADSTRSSPGVMSLLGGLDEWTASPFVMTLDDRDGVVVDGQPVPSAGPAAALSPFPESWLTIPGGDSAWTADLNGVSPVPSSERVPSRGFRACRRLSAR